MAEIHFRDYNPKQMEQDIRKPRAAMLRRKQCTGHSAAKDARFGAGASRQWATGESKSTTGWRNTGEKLLKDLLRKRA